MKSSGNVKRQNLFKLKQNTARNTCEIPGYHTALCWRNKILQRLMPCRWKTFIEVSDWYQALNCNILKIEAVRHSETLVAIYRSARGYMLEDLRLQLNISSPNTGMRRITTFRSTRTAY